MSSLISKKCLSLLQKTCTDNYYIEYEDFLSNHASHGLVALSSLGASDNKLEQWTDWYIQRLEKPPIHDQLNSTEGKEIIIILYFDTQSYK